MAKAGTKTEAEQLAEDERQAQSALAALPAPEHTVLTGSAAEDERQAEAEALALAQQEDQRSDASDHARLLHLERLFEENTRMLEQILQRGGIAPLIQPATPDDLPRPRKEWTEEELRELVTITIFPEADPHQNRPVQVSLNGRPYVIPRGEPVRVPRAVALILEHAVIEGWEHPIENGRHLAEKTDLTTLTTTPPVLRRLPRFNFAYS